MVDGGVDIMTVFGPGERDDKNPPATAGSGTPGARSPCPLSKGLSTADINNGAWRLQQTMFNGEVLSQVGPDH